MKGYTLKTMALICICAIFLVGCGGSTVSKATNEKSGIKNTKNQDKTVFKLASDNKDFSTLVAAIQKAGLESLLSSDSTLTLFAPTNDAFAKLGKEQLERLLSDSAELMKVITYHAIISEMILKGDLTDGQTLITAQGGKLMVSLSGEEIFLTSHSKVKAKVTFTQEQGSNGVLHSIDTVLLPENLNLS